MKNGKLETWQVVRWLNKHREHTAKAPDTAAMYPARVHACGRVLVFEGFIVGEWSFDNMPEQRSDWTIYDEHGSKVDFKRKRESLVVGELRKGEGLLVVDGFSGEVKSNLLTNGGSYTVDILIRERRK